MQTCPDCHVLVNDSAVFCDNCGFRLKPADIGPHSPAGGGLVSPPAGSGILNLMTATPAVVNAAAGSCSACGYVNTPGETFCQNCGVQLAPVASVPPPPPTPVLAGSVSPQPAPSPSAQPIAPTAAVACPTCGYTNPPGETYCQNCGVALISGTQPPAPSGVLDHSLQPSNSSVQPLVSNPERFSVPPPPISTVPGVCPTCNYKNPPGEAYCQNCGMELINDLQPSVANPPPPIPDLQSPIREPQASGPCPTCGYTNLSGETYCQNCGLLLAAPEGLTQTAIPDTILPIEAPSAVPEPEAISPNSTLEFPGSNFLSAAPDTKPLTPPSPLPITSSQPPEVIIGHLVVAETQTSLPLPQGKTQFLLGRPDPAGGIFPDIDLSLHGGEAGGVSRQHARLTINGGQILIEDLHSMNATFLNKQRLPPEKSFLLNDGDEIRLGGLVLYFHSS